MSKENNKKPTPEYLLKFIRERERIKRLPIAKEQKTELNRIARHKFYEDRRRYYEREPNK